MIHTYFQYTSCLNINGLLEQRDRVPNSILEWNGGNEAHCGEILSWFLSPKCIAFKLAWIRTWSDEKRIYQTTHSKEFIFHRKMSEVIQIVNLLNGDIGFIMVPQYGFNSDMAICQNSFGKQLFMATHSHE